MDMEGVVPNVVPPPVARPGRFFVKPYKPPRTAAQKAAAANARLQGRVGYAQSLLANNTQIAERIAATAKSAAQSVVAMRNPMIPKDQRITLAEACAQAGLGAGKANELATLVKQQAETAKLQAKCLEKEARKLSGHHKKKVSPVEKLVRLRVEANAAKERSNTFLNKLLSKGIIVNADVPEIDAEIAKRDSARLAASMRAQERAKAKGKVTRIRRSRTAAAVQELMTRGL